MSKYERVVARLGGVIVGFTELRRSQNMERRFTQARTTEPKQGRISVQKADGMVVLQQLAIVIDIVPFFVGTSLQYHCCELIARHGSLGHFEVR